MYCIFQSHGDSPGVIRGHCGSKSGFVSLRQIRRDPIAGCQSVTKQVAEDQKLIRVRHGIDTRWGPIGATLIRFLTFREGSIQPANRIGQIR